MLTREQRKLIRDLAGVHNPTQPVHVIPGSTQPPAVEGESWHYETMGGRRIYHPSAYSRRGWSNMRYCPSTRRLVVGEEFLRQLDQQTVAVARA